MREYNTPYSRTIITCSQCMNKLRVPADKGKIAVICPVCRKEFIYNPNSILATLKQIGLSILAKFPKNRNIRFLLLAVLLILILFLLYYLVSNLISPETTIVTPLPKS